MDKLIDKEIKKTNKLVEDAKVQAEKEILKETSQMVKEAVKEEISSLVESQNQLMEQSKLLVEKQKDEIVTLTEQKEQLVEEMNLQIETINTLTEETENLSIDFQMKIEQEKKQNIILEEKLIVSHAQNHVNKLMKEDYMLRSYYDVLNECKTVAEVDMKVKAFREAEEIVKKNNTELPQGKGICSPEIIKEHFKSHGTLESNDQDSLDEGKQEEQRLAGIEREKN